MKTDDLVAALATDLPPTGVARLRTGLALVLIPAALLTLGGLALTLGFRPDLDAAVAGPTFWTKAAYTVLAAATGAWLLDRAGRPGASLREPLISLAVVGVALVLAATVSLMITPETGRMAAIMGGSARVCSANVAGLSLLAAPFVLFGARRFAPTRPGLAGAATGLLTGGLAATLYGLHCPEHSAAFVAIWYTLGMAVPAAIGAVMGRGLWRW